MAWDTPWRWDGWRGVRNWIWYWIGRRAVWMANYVVMRGYRL